MLTEKAYAIRKNSGQALIEFLPSAIIFIIVVGAGLNYFQVMREAVIRQEVVRSVMFGKIDNSGTLTTPTSQRTYSFSLKGFPEQGEVVTEQRFEPIQSSDSCFMTTPETVRKRLNTRDVQFLGKLADVNITTYAVIYRNTGGGNQLAQCPK